MELVNYNGRFYPESALPIAAGHLGLRYGVGLFETMRWTRGSIPLHKGHFERLFWGLKQIGLPTPPIFSVPFFLAEIEKTIRENQIVGDARVRLHISALPGPDTTPMNLQLDYRIETAACDALIFNALGINIGVSKRGFSGWSTPFSAFKTGNYLPYWLGQQEAQQRDLEEVLLFNNKGRIGESNRSNVFWVHQGSIYTPPLRENIVAGVAKAHLMKVLSDNGNAVQELPLTQMRLRQAESLFLTNAFQGLRWVASCEGKTYQPGQAEWLFNKAFADSVL